MTEKLIQDRGGNCLRVMEYNGYLIQPFLNLGPRLEALPDLAVRDDDMVVLGFPKSGNHWAWEICCRLLSNNLGESSQSLSELMIEPRDNDYLDKHPSPRIFSGHLPPKIISRTKLFDGNHKIVYIIRNPKDIAVSYYLQTYAMKILYGYDGKWDDYFELFLNGEVDSGSWFDHVLNMEQFRSNHPEIPIHFVFYENLTKDSMAEIKKLASFLGVDRTERFLNQLNEITMFKPMKENHDKHATDELKSIYRDGVVSMFRKGVVGDWRTYFTDDQSRRMNSQFTLKMKGSKIQFPFMAEMTSNP